MGEVTQSLTPLSDLTLGLTSALTQTPPSRDSVLTEGGDRLTAESGDRLQLE